MAVRDTLIINAGEKLDALPIGFKTPVDLDKCLNDTVRELNISADSIDINSTMALYIELNIVWWALFRYKNSSSVFFKYSTNEDGTSVDKSMIPKEISKIMTEIRTQANMLMSKSASASGVLNLLPRESTTLS